MKGLELWFMVFVKNHLTWRARHVSIITFISQKIRESVLWSKGAKGPYQKSQYRITPSVIYIMFLASSICISP